MAFSPDALRKIIEGSNLKFKQNAVSYIFECPRCQKTDKLYIRKSDGRFVCWVCKESSNFQGRAEFALVELMGGILSNYRSNLYGTTDGPLDHIELQLADHWGEEDDDLEFWAPRKFTGYDWPYAYVPHSHKLFKKGAAYFESRGIPQFIIEKYDLRYSVPEHRVIFPFIIDGELVGWQGRYCGNTKKEDPDTGRLFTIPKALTALQKQIQGHYVMFGDNLDTTDHCVLCEGPTDALKAEKCGGNVAALGKGVTESQIYWISQRVKKLYIALDPDAGIEISRIARIAISLGMDVWLMVPPEGRKDFGECTLDETFEAYKNAQPLNGNSVVVSLGESLVF